MTVTVWGECGGPNTVAASRDRYGRLSARSYRELSLELPAEGIEIDATTTGSGSASSSTSSSETTNGYAPSVCSTATGSTDVDQPVYFSPMLEMRGHGIDRTDTYIARAAEMIGLSVTFQTARLGAHPVSGRQGDLRDPVDRFSRWPCELATLRPAARTRTRPSRHRLACENPQRLEDRRPARRRRLPLAPASAADMATGRHPAGRSDATLAARRRRLVHHQRSLTSLSQAMGKAGATPRWLNELPRWACNARGPWTKRRRGKRTWASMRPDAPSSL